MIGFVSLSILMFVIVALVFWQVIKHDNTMRRYGVAASILLLAPVTFGIYLVIGSPVAINPKQPTGAPMMAEGITADDINNMVARLEERLKGETDDVQGLAMLARSYRVKGELAKSLETYGRLVALEPSNIEWRINMIDISTSAQEGFVDDVAFSWIEQALDIEPQNANLLWLAGLAKVQRQQIEQAKLYWQQLLPLLEGQPQQTELQVLLNELDRLDNKQ
jgi:cytochrome c-type biogenesis protein CcmH